MASLFDIRENGAISTIVVYPNPTKDVIYVSGLPENSIYTFELINTLGQIVLRGNLEENQPISVQNLPDGLYAIDISGKDGWKWKSKVIIE